VNGHVVKELAPSRYRARPHRGSGQDRRAPSGEAIFHSAQTATRSLHDERSGRAPTPFSSCCGHSPRVSSCRPAGLCPKRLLLLTSDGRTWQIASLSWRHRLPQTYWVKVKGRLAAADLAKLGERLHARVEPIRAPQAARQAPEPVVYGDLCWREPRSAAARIVRHGAPGRKAPPCRHSRFGT